MDDQLKLKGEVTGILRGPDGKIKQKVHISNLVVTAGKNYLAQWLAAASQALPFMSYIAIGSGQVTADVADVALGTELTRKQGSVTYLNNVWTNSYTFLAADGTGDVYEAGLFSAAAAGTMFARTKFGLVTKEAGDTFQVVWNVTLG